MLAFIFLLSAQLSNAMRPLNPPCEHLEDCFSCKSVKHASVDECEWCTTDNKCYPSVNFCPLTRQAQITYNCPVDALKAPSYSESFAARFALPMVAAAMANTSLMLSMEKCLRKHFPRIAIINTYAVPCLDNTRECFAYLAYLTDAHAAVLVFRGSTEEQVLHDVLRASFGKMVHLHTINGSVYEFYFDAFSNLWHAIEVDLRTLVRSDRSMRFWVFGHSIASGLASIASAILSAQGYVSSDRIKLVTFGQPRMSDALFAQNHDRLVPHSFRLINKNDIIPTLPARAFPFSHSGPFHHRYEVWYPQGISTGAWHLLATMAEDGRSSNSVISLSVKDHLFAFDKNIANWWRLECVG